MGSFISLYNLKRSRDFLWFKFDRPRFGILSPLSVILPPNGLFRKSELRDWAVSVCPYLNMDGVSRTYCDSCWWEIWRPTFFPSSSFWSDFWPNLVSFKCTLWNEVWKKVLFKVGASFFWAEVPRFDFCKKKLVQYVFDHILFPSNLLCESRFGKNFLSSKIMYQKRRFDWLPLLHSVRYFKTLQAQMVRRVKAYLNKMRVVTDEEKLHELSLECEGAREGGGGSTSGPIRKRNPSPTLSTASSASSASEGTRKHAHPKFGKSAWRKLQKCYINSSMLSGLSKKPLSKNNSN